MKIIALQDKRDKLHKNTETSFTKKKCIGKDRAICACVAVKLQQESRLISTIDALFHCCCLALKEEEKNDEKCPKWQNQACISQLLKF